MKNIFMGFVCAVAIAFTLGSHPVKVHAATVSMDACSDSTVEEAWAQEGWDYSYGDYNYQFANLVFWLDPANGLPAEWQAGGDMYNSTQQAIALDQETMTVMSGIITQDEQVKRQYGCPAH